MCSNAKSTMLKLLLGKRDFQSKLIIRQIMFIVNSMLFTEKNTAREDVFYLFLKYNFMDFLNKFSDCRLSWTFLPLSDWDHLSHDWQLLITTGVFKAINRKTKHSLILMLVKLDSYWAVPYFAANAEPISSLFIALSKNTKIELTLQKDLI